MRIIHMAATPSGAPWMIAFLREQRRLGHEVAAIIPSGDGTIAPILEREGIEFHTLPLDLFVSKGLLDGARRIWGLAALFRRLRPDVVHSHILQTVVIARLAGWLADVPLRLSMNAGPFSLESPVLRAVEIGTAWADTKTIVSCRKTAELYQRYGVPADRLELIYYGSDPDSLEPERAEPERVRRELGIRPEQPTVGIVAYFYAPLTHPTVTPPHLLGRSSKGQDVLIRALPHVLAEFPEARFVLVGKEWGRGNGFEETLRQLADSLGVSRAVIFAGERHDVRDVLASFDISVHCSLTENLGGSVESLMMARPMIVSDVGGLVDTVIHEETGLVVPPDDPPALAAAILRLLRDRDLALRLGENGRRLMLERFTMQRSVADFDDLYRRLGADQRHPPRESHYRFSRTLVRSLILPFRILPLVRRTRAALLGRMEQSDRPAVVERAPEPVAAPNPPVEPNLVAAREVDRPRLRPPAANPRGLPALRIAQIVGAWEGCGWFVDLCDGLAVRGHEVVAIIDSQPGDLADRLAQRGIRTFKVPMSFAANSDRGRIASYVAGIPVAALRIARILWKTKVDLAQSHIFTPVVMTRFAAAMARTPHVATIPGPRHLEAPLTKLVDRITWWLDDLTVATCRKTYDLYLEAGAPKGKLEVVYYGSDPNRFDPARHDGTAVRQEFGIAPGTAVVGIVAHFYPPTRGPQTPPHMRGVGLKGHEDFLAAARSIAGRRPDSRFLLVGAGHRMLGESYRLDLIDACRRDPLLEGRVIFTGKRADVPALLAAMDVVVQCSLTENLGGTIESLMMERPTVATRVGGMPEAVRDGETGLLVAPGQPHELAEAILRLLGDRPLATRLGRNGRELMLRDFTREHTIDQTESLLCRVGNAGTAFAPDQGSCASE